MAEIHEGGCLCRAVRYRASGGPAVTTACHCRFCQRISGSAFAIEPWFLKTNVGFEGETAHVYDYRSPEHGRLLHIQFCSNCGSRVGFTADRFPTMQAMYAGTFDDPTLIDPKWHIFTKEAVAWMKFPEDATCFEGHCFNEDGKLATPWQTPRQAG